MAKRKVVFTWNEGQVNAVYGTLLQYMQHLGNSTEERLAAHILRKLLEKILPKYTWPEKENKISMKMEEVLALKLASERVDLHELGEYQAAVMIQFINQIDKI